MGERKKAAALYRGFREADPDKVLQFDIDIPRTVMVLGHAEYIGYRTTHGAGRKKKLTLYEHPFAPGSRPLLCVSPDGKQLLLIGGRYQVTELGIVDVDQKGRLVTNPKHGRTL